MALVGASQTMTALALRIPAAMGLAALLASLALGACSRGERVAPHVVASGTTSQGVEWVTEASVNRASLLCLEVRQPRDHGNESSGGGCGWSGAGEPRGGSYGVFGGPGGGQFALGPLPSLDSSVRVSAPGHPAVVIQASALPDGDGAPAFFVWQVPDSYPASGTDFQLLNGAGRPVS